MRHDDLPLMGMALAKLIFTAALLLGLPLLGAGLAGRPVAPYLRFPPRPEPGAPPPFAWEAPAVLAVAGVVVAALALAMALPPRGERAPPLPVRRRFPWWGWAAGVVLGVAWALAWSRLDAPGGLQRYTFTPLWAGYVVLANALAWWRGGRCPLLERPALFAALFPASSVFWWYFEFLNRFVHNWHYVGTEEMPDVQYALSATLSFSTVLPAVLSTAALLGAFPALNHPRARLPGIRLSRPRAWAWLLLAAGAAALAGMAVWPAVLYPLVWLAPLLLLVALQPLFGQRSYLAPLAGGDWRPVLLPALAALVCGFFWELWNVHSVARWQYTVPYAQALQVFEMPVLGYFGYLPFGLECAIVAQYLGRLFGVPLPGWLWQREPGPG